MSGRDHKQYNWNLLEHLEQLQPENNKLECRDVFFGLPSPACKSEGPTQQARMTQQQSHHACSILMSAPLHWKQPCKISTTLVNMFKQGETKCLWIICISYMNKGAIKHNHVCTDHLGGFSPNSTELGWMWSSRSSLKVLVRWKTLDGVICDMKVYEDRNKKSDKLPRALSHR